MKLPNRLQPKAKRALHDILAAETREQAEEHLAPFVAESEAKYPKAAAWLATDREALLIFFAFPAEPWIHLRTTNVIESPFATVRLRQRGTKGAGSRTKGLLMACKLLDMAQRRWRHGGTVDQGRQAGGALDTIVVSPVPRERGPAAAERARLQPGQPVAAAGPAGAHRAPVIGQSPAAPGQDGWRLVKHARYYWLLLAEGHLTRRLFGTMLQRIWALPVPAG